jgi:Protein of unknown function (DUF2971)
MADRLASEVYPRLYHYTTYEGALNILKTNCLWATHYKFLNDYSEIILFKEKLLTLLRPPVEEAFQKLLSENQNARERIARGGGLDAAVQHDTAGAITAMYQALGDVYIASFCGEHEDAYINDNGLLSQWRGYGGSGGVALVFRTDGLEELLNEDNQAYDYIAGIVADLVYSDDEERFNRELSPYLATIRDYTTEMFSHTWLGKKQAPDATNFLPAFVNCISRYKHRGFKEENEVRVVAVPVAYDEDTLATVRELGATLKREKEPKYRPRRGQKVPYIELFQSLNKSLPVEKIVVGPHPDRKARACELQSMLKGKHVAVTISDIPYVC